MNLLNKMNVISALVCFIITSGTSVAQSCGTYHSELYSKKYFQELLKRKPKDSHNLFKQVNNKKVIPVVFHVLFNNNTNNISDTQIIDELKVLNEDFQQSNSDLGMVDSAFQNIIGNANIEFRLAKLDPDGECTTGINRVFSGLTEGSTEHIKTIVKWDVDKYLNVWVVENIAFPFSVLGYSFFPSLGGDDDENAGVVILNNQLGSTGTATTDHQRTLTHEMGHYLNLHHTWGTNGWTGLASNCSEDDGIFDTPNTVGSLYCDQDSSCGSLDNEQNFMENTDCQLMFTQGQTLAMDNTLLMHDTGLAPRYNLWQETNLLATGTNDNYDSTIICPPNASFTTGNRVVCLGGQVNFEVYELRGPTLSQTWQSNKAISIINANDGIIEFNELGYHNVSLIVGNNGGDKTITQDSTVLVVDINTIETPIYNESFLNSNSVNIENTTPWLTTSFYNSKWEVMNTVSSDLDSKCLGIQTYTGSLIEPDGVTWTSPKLAELIMPLFDLSNENSGLKLYFDYAFKGLHEISDQTFTIEASKDCGESWTIVYEKDDLELLNQGEYFATAPKDSLYNPNPWIPNADQWNKLIVPMGGFAGEDIVMVRIRTAGIDGHYLYIDNFELTSSPLSINEEDGLGTWFASAPGVIHINPDINLGNIQSLSVFDVQGKQVLYQSTFGHTEISHGLPEGIYLIQIRVTGDGQIKNKKIWLE